MEILLPIASLLVGAVVGYLLRIAEFRREKRLVAYAECASAFIDAAHAGAGLYSLHMSFGERAPTEAPEQFRTLWAAAGDAIARFETCINTLRLVAGMHGLAASEVLDEFIASNVRMVPPYRLGDSDKWGAAARIGPSEVDKQAVIAARQFADQARRDLAR